LAHLSWKRVIDSACAPGRDLSGADVSAGTTWVGAGAGSVSSSPRVSASAAMAFLSLDIFLPSSWWREPNSIATSAGSWPFQ